MNDYEFELLCKDVLEIELNKKLRTYSKGKDGGIDISSFVIDDTIVQVKHYMNSKYSSLLSNLKKEIEKVKLLEQKNYYICTSLRLTPRNTMEIYNLYKDYMKSPENIYDGTRIDSFLEENVDVVHKHYKLWLTSSNVLELINNKNIYIDTEELMFGIEKEICLFVETDAYYDAIKVLNKDNLIIILGDPGAGKTTTSKMLLLYYSSIGYCVRYTSDNSIKDIKKALSTDINKKEIILMDDFLGQHYLNLKEEQPSEIKTLITYILKNKNKKLILNSRITILNEALRRNFQLDNFLNDYKVKKYQIDLNQMPILEKAKIFYNHIYFNFLPIEYFNNIKRESRYIHIINHKNYNPRIIEYVTKPGNYEKCDPNKYCDYIFGKLDNPQDVWEDEFQNRVGNFDRLFMHTLYSLTNTFIEEIILKECFNTRIKNKRDYDSTKDMFSECLTRLSKSMVRIIEEKGKKKIGVINPSINDYIFYSLNNNDNEVDFILNNAVYIEQCDRVGKINEEKAKKHNINKIQNNQYLSMKAINQTIRYRYMVFIYRCRYKDLAIKDILIDIIYDPKTYDNNPRDNTSKFLCELFSDSDIMEFYGLKDLLFDFSKMKPIFKELVFEDLNIFLSIYKSFNNKEADKEDWIQRLESTLEEYIIDNISEEVEAHIQDNLNDIIHSAIEDGGKYISRDYRRGFESSLTDIVKVALITEIEILIEEKKDEIDSELFSIHQFDIDSGNILDQINYESHIDDYFQPDQDYDDYRGHSSGSGGYEEVHQIFDREYITKLV
jgi:adenylate kinase family enzyme